MSKMCTVCRIEKEDVKFGFAFDKGYRKNVCEQCRKVRQKARLWLKFLEAFDFKCVCCGEDDIRLLTVDHVQNDGNKDNRNTIVVLRQALEEGFPKERYACLCWNCNCGRAANGGTCPHKITQTKQEYFEYYTQVAKYIPHKYSGRPRLYTPEEVETRNKAAQVMFKLRHGKHNFTPEQIQQLIEQLKTVV